MKAIIVNNHEDGNPLTWGEVSSPQFGADEVLVDVHATALNRADLLQRSGNYPPPPGASKILGLEMAGTIAAVGNNVTGWKVGDKVCSLLSGGGYATQVAVPEQLLMPIPSDWSFDQAAALPEVFYTAYVNLFMEAGLQAGETVLIHGGASGVGTAAIQLAIQTGCTVYATAGTIIKTAWCKALGAEEAINYKMDDFVQRILKLTGGEGMDVILDMVGGPYLHRNVDLLKLKGRLVIIGLLGGAQGEVNLAKVLRRRLRIIGSVLRSRSLEEKVEIKQRFMNQFWPLLESDTIQPVIDSVYPIQEAGKAHAFMAANKNIGKIVLQVRT